MKRSYSLILALAVMLGSAVSCKSETVKDPNEPTTSGTHTVLNNEIIITGGQAPAIQTSTVQPPADLETSVGAASGDLYLSITNGDMSIQYNGNNTDPKHTMLSYNAVTAPITGNGDYTVGVTADTKGFRFDVTGDENDTSVLPEGLQYLAVVYKEGKKLNPNAVITVKAVRVDGQEIPFKAKAYTASDDGTDLKANVYNEWADSPSPNALSADGPLYNNGEPAAFAGEYSPSIVDTDSFAKWTNVEIDVTVSGIE